MFDRDPRSTRSLSRSSNRSFDSIPDVACACHVLRSCHPLQDCCGARPLVKIEVCPEPEVKETALISAGWSLPILLVTLGCSTAGEKTTLEGSVGQPLIYGSDDRSEASTGLAYGMVALIERRAIQTV